MPSDDGDDSDRLNSLVTWLSVIAVGLLVLGVFGPPLPRMAIWGIVGFLVLSASLAVVVDFYSALHGGAPKKKRK